MTRIQQIDITYDSVNFDDPISTLSYFTKLCQVFLPLSEKEINKRLKILMKQIKKKTKDDSAGVLAQHIMRSAAERIHGVVREFNQDSVLSTSWLASLVIQEAMESLFGLIRDDDPSRYWKILSG